MRAAIASLCLLLFAVLYSPADTGLPAQQPVKFAGLTEAQVINILGKPKGKMQKGGETIWLYDRGEIMFSNGVVSDDRIMSEAAWKAKLAAPTPRSTPPPPPPRRVEKQAPPPSEDYSNLPDATPTAPATFAMEQISSFDAPAAAQPLTRGQYAYCVTMQEKRPPRYPALASAAPLQGSIRAGIARDVPNSGISCPFVCDESAGTGKGFDRLYFDLNGNQDLSDEAPIALSQTKPKNTIYTSQWVKHDLFSAPFEILCDKADRRTVEVIARLSIGEDDRANIVFIPTRVYSGKIKVGGRVLTATLGRDLGLHWRLDDSGTALYLYDLAKRQSLSSWSNGDTLQATHRIGETLYQFSASPSGHQLTVRPYAGQTGLFEFAAGNRQVKGELRITGTLASKETSVRIGPGENTYPLKGLQKGCIIPVGDYEPLTLSATLGTLAVDVSANRYSENGTIKNSIARGISIRSDTPCAWTFSNRPTIIFVSPDKDQRIKAGTQAYINAGLVDMERDVMIRGLTRIEQDGRRVPIPPNVTITRSDGKIVAEGVMPFG